MRNLLVLVLLFSTPIAHAYTTDNGIPADTLDNFQVPPIYSPQTNPMEAPLPPDSVSEGPAPGVNRQTIPTPLQQTGTQTRTMTAPLTVDADLAFTDLMTDEVTLQYQYYYRDAAIIPWRQDAAIFANKQTDQTVQIQRFSDVIYLSLFLMPAGRGAIECLPAAIGQGPRTETGSFRQEILGKVLPEEMHVEVIGTTDANGNGHCQIIILQ